MAITALPTPPSRQDPANFADRADEFLGALPLFVTEANTLATDVNTLAGNAATSAINAANQVTLAANQVTLATTQAGNAATSATSASSFATMAASYAGAIAWVSGTTYAINDVRFSPINGRLYRRITTGAGTTDPSADGTNWKLIDTNPRVELVSGTSVTMIANTHYVFINVAATAGTLPASPSQGDVVFITVANNLITNTVLRNGSTIMGLTQDMTLDNMYLTTGLRYLNSSWRII